MTDGLMPTPRDSTCPQCGWSMIGGNGESMPDGMCSACRENTECGAVCEACNRHFMSGHRTLAQRSEKFGACRCDECAELDPGESPPIIYCCGHADGCGRVATERRRMLIDPSKIKHYCAAHAKMSTDHLTFHEQVAQWQAWGFRCRIVKIEGGETVRWAFDAGDVPAQWQALYERFERETPLA